MDASKKSDYRLTIKALTRKYLNVFALTIGMFAFNYVVNLVLIRSLSPGAYGDIKVILKLMVFTMPFILWGSELSVIRAYPQYIAHEDFNSLKGFRRWSHRIFSTSFVIVLILGFIAGIVAWHLDNVHAKLYHYHPIIYAVWLLPLFALMKLYAAELQAIQRFILTRIYSDLKIILWILAIIVMRMIKGEVNIYEVIVALGGTIIIILCIQHLTLKKLLPKKLKKAKPDYRDKKHWRKESIEMMFNTIVTGGLMAIDIILLEALGKSDHQVGQFAALSVLVGLIALGKSAANAVIAPEIGFMLERHNKPKLQKLLNIFNGFKFVALAIGLAVVILFGHVFLGLFGAAYEQLYPELMLFVGFKTVNVLFGSGRQLLLYSEHEHRAMKIAILQLALLVISGIILIPYYQLWGIIWAIGITWIVSGFVTLYSVRKLVGMKILFFI